MRLAHIAPYSPLDWGSGGHTRIAATLARLRQEWDVDGFYVSDEVGGSVASPVHRWRDPRGGIWDRLRRVQHLVALRAGFPSSDFFAVSTSEVVSEARRRAASADVALVEFGQMAPCAPLGVPSVLVAYDLAWAKTVAQTRTQADRGVRRLERWRTRAEGAALERLELGYYGRFDHLVVVSEHDRQTLEAAFDAAGQTAHPRVSVSPNGIDWLDYGLLRGSGQPGTAGFVGGLEHPPNVDAVDLLVDAVLPGAPELRTLYLAGGGTDAFAGDRITGLGRVEDIKAVYERVSFTVAPVTWGSGSRLKILESMAARRPVVALEQAAEGLESLWPSDGLIVVPTVREFIEVTRRLAADPSEAARRGAAGRESVARFDWATTLAPLMDVLRSLAA